MDEGVGSVHAGEQARIDVLWHSLQRDIRRRGVDAHLADDVAQETWLRIAARPPREDRPLRPWLFVVGSHILAEVRRRDLSRRARERRAARREVVELEAPREDSRILRLVAELPEPYRGVVTLRYVDDFEVEEIARRLRRSPATIRSQLKRGLERLRCRLDEHDGRNGRSRRSARSLLAWLRRLCGRDERGWNPVLAALGIGSGLALVALLSWSARRADSEPAVRVAGLASEDAPRATLDSGARRVAARDPAGASASNVEETALSSASLPPRSVSGTVRYPDGTPAAGASIWKGPGRSRGIEVVARTDAAGRYTVAAVEFERFLWATFPGWLPSRRSHAGTLPDGKASDLVLASPRGRLRLELREEGGGALADVEFELDWSLAHPATALFSAAGELRYESEFESGRTDGRGRLELPLPRASSGELRIRRSGFADHVEPVSFAPDDVSLELVLPQPTERDEHQNVSPILEVEPEDLHGVALAAGQPLANALVLCSPAGASGAPLRTYTDARGRFGFSVPPSETVDLKLYGPAWDLLCARESVPVGSDELVLSSSLDPSPRRIVLEFECEDPALLPTLVELRSTELHDKARVFAVDAATRTCTVLAPRSSAFEVFPWVPALGAWCVASTALASGERQRISVPTPARVRFRLDLPPGVPAESIRGGLRVPGLMSTWVASRAGLLSIRELALDPASLEAETRVFPGNHPFAFDGPGLAHASGVVRVAGGDSVTEVVRMDPGVEARVVVRFPAQAVTPVLSVRTPEGLRSLEGAPVEVAGSRATFVVGLPRDALALQARAKGLSGSRVVLPGELASSTGVPELTIELEDHARD